MKLTLKSRKFQGTTRISRNTAVMRICLFVISGIPRTSMWIMLSPFFISKKKFSTLTTFLQVLRLTNIKSVFLQIELISRSLKTSFSGGEVGYFFGEKALENKK